MKKYVSAVSSGLKATVFEVFPSQPELKRG
jgi:hypothetical protein